MSHNTMLSHCIRLNIPTHFVLFNVGRLFGRAYFRVPHSRLGDAVHRPSFEALELWLITTRSSISTSFLN